MSRTNFYGLKSVRANEGQLYIYKKLRMLLRRLLNRIINQAFWVSQYVQFFISIQITTFKELTMIANGIQIYIGRKTLLNPICILTCFCMNEYICLNQNMKEEKKTRGPRWPCMAHLITRQVSGHLAFRFNKDF